MAMLIILAMAAHMNAAGGPADSFDDVRRFARQHQLRDLWDLHDAPNAVPGLKRLVCGRTDRRVRSGSHRLVYVEAGDGTPPAIFEENDPPKSRTRFEQLWHDGGCGDRWGPDPDQPEGGGAA